MSSSSRADELRAQLRAPRLLQPHHRALLERAMPSRFKPPIQVRVPPAERPVARVDVDERLATGTYGAVYTATSKKGVRYAVKFSAVNDGDDFAAVYAEMLLLKYVCLLSGAELAVACPAHMAFALNHEPDDAVRATESALYVNIVTPLGESASTYIARERAAPRSAGVYAGLVNRLMLGLMQAVSYLHAVHIAHRDLKLANAVLVPERDGAGRDMYRAVLIDFNLAQVDVEGARGTRTLLGKARQRLARDLAESRARTYEKLSVLLDHALEAGVDMAFSGYDATAAAFTVDDIDIDTVDRAASRLDGQGGRYLPWPSPDVYTKARAMNGDTTFAREWRAAVYLDTYALVMLYLVALFEEWRQVALNETVVRVAYLRSFMRTRYRADDRGRPLDTEHPRVLLDGESLLDAALGGSAPYDEWRASFAQLLLVAAGSVQMDVP